MEEVDEREIFKGIRVAKCHRYGRYINVRILAGWGKKCGRTCSLDISGSFGGKRDSGSWTADNKSVVKE